MQIAYNEKEKVLQELEEINTMKNVNLIDQYKKDYENVIAEIKQIDNLLLLQNDRSKEEEEELKKQREEFNQKKKEYMEAFEEQLRREEEFPSRICELKEQQKALEFQIEHLQEEVGKEEHVVEYHKNYHKKLSDSILSTLQTCEEYLVDQVIDYLIYDCVEIYQIV